jgi:hypothetical protein
MKTPKYELEEIPEYELEEPATVTDGVLETNLSARCRSRSSFWGRTYRCWKRMGHDGWHERYDDGIRLAWDGTGQYEIVEPHR